MLDVGHAVGGRRPRRPLGRAPGLAERVADGDDRRTARGRIGDAGDRRSGAARPRPGRRSRRWRTSGRTSPPTGPGARAGRRRMAASAAAVGGSTDPVTRTTAAARRRTGAGMSTPQARGATVLTFVHGRPRADGAPDLGRRFVPGPGARRPARVRGHRRAAARRGRRPLRAHRGRHGPGRRLRARRTSSTTPATCSSPTRSTPAWPRPATGGTPVPSRRRRRAALRWMASCALVLLAVPSCASR